MYCLLIFVGEYSRLNGLLFCYRRLQEAEDKNRDLLTTVARREEALHQNNVRILTIAPDQAFSFFFSIKYCDIFFLFLHENMFWLFIRKASLSVSCQGFSFLCSQYFYPSLLLKVHPLGPVWLPLSQAPWQYTVKPVLVVTSIKQPTCIKQPEESCTKVHRHIFELY